MSYDPIDDAMAQRYELSLDQAKQRIATLESEVAALRAEVEGMREDAERLEWVEKNLFDHHWNGVIGSGSRTDWSLISGYRHRTATMVGPTFRDALDAARKESSNG